MNAATAKATPAPASDPQTGWRNYRTAPFWFVPRPLANEEEVITSISALLQQFGADPSAISTTASEVRIAIGEIRFEVNFEYGVVGASARDSSGMWEISLGHGHPEKFAAAAFDAADDEPHREDLGKAAILARYLTDRFQSRLRSAVTSGTAHVMARAGSPLAPYERILPDQWRHFRMRPIAEDPDDIPFDDLFAHETEADGPAREVLYSVMFIPGIEPKPAADRSARPHSIGAQMSEWLLETRMREPPLAGETQKTLKELSRGKFPHQHKRDFEEALEIAKSKGAHLGWYGRGRRPGASKNSPKK